MISSPFQSWCQRHVGAEMRSLCDSQLFVSSQQRARFVAHGRPQAAPGRSAVRAGSGLKDPSERHHYSNVWIMQQIISLVVYITFNVVAPVSQTHDFFLDFSIGIEVRVCRNAPSKCEFFTGYQGCAIKSLWKDKWKPHWKHKLNVEPWLALPKEKICLVSRSILSTKLFHFLLNIRFHHV